MGAVEKAKVLETALDQLQKRNGELLTELEHRTQWEAVRLSTALRDRASEEQQRAELAIEQAMNVQNERFEAVLKRQQKKMEGALAAQVAQETAQIKAQCQEELVAAINAERATAQANEQELAETMEINLARKAANEAEGRMEAVRDMQLQLQALSQVVADDARYKQASHEVHRVSQAVMSISHRLESSAPFKAELAELRDIASEDPVIAAAVAYIPAAASQRGVATMAQLQSSFGALAAETRRAALMPEDAGLVWVPLSYIFDFIKFQPKGMVSGDSCEEILARVEHHLLSNNLSDAVKEASIIQGTPGQVLMDWKGAAAERLQVEQALTVVKAHSACLVAMVAD